jgi:hypothetical protein
LTDQVVVVRPITTHYLQAMCCTSYLKLPF